MIASKYPDWAPSDMLAWLQRMDEGPKASKVKGQFPLRLFDLLLTDPRMREVWEWHARDRAGKPDSVMTSSLALCSDVARATVLPGKPGNLPPKEREKYLLQVREHAQALINLLKDTRFDGHIHGDEIPEGDLLKKVQQDLQPWSDQDDGRVVAYYVDEDAVYSLGWDYPASHGVIHLRDLVEWTYWDDCWDGSFLKSSAPIAQANSASSKIVYFTCTLHSQLRRWGMTIPFPVLATLANVALKLPVASQVDEEAVRKQVRRFEARIAAVNKAREEEDPFSDKNFAWPAGEVTDDGSDIPF
jgi:hypothetical protein